MARKGERKHQVWTEDNWDDGYVDNHNRYRVYRPDCPRQVGDEGYALRAHVVWWLRTGECHPQGSVLHHRDGNSLHDSFENLECKTIQQHTSDHRLTIYHFTCVGCGKEFTRTGDQVSTKRCEGRVPKYCTHLCFLKNWRRLRREEANG